MFFNWVGPRSGDPDLKSPFHLTVSIFRKADCAWRRDAFQARGNVDAIAHQVSVLLLHHITNVDADPELDAAVLGQAGVAPRTVLFWISIAQRTASTTLRNSMIAPSPVRLTTRP